MFWKAPLEVLVDPVGLNFLCVEPDGLVVSVNLYERFADELYIVQMQLSFFTGIKADHNFSKVRKSLF
ncbi:MAG: hypothetical protein ACI977_000365 [Candidatus Nanohaloarchaea archaeon]|jgi:hypothetical protein